MRVGVVVCEECGELSRTDLSEHLLANLMHSQVCATSLEDDLALIALGWQVVDGRHYCPDHWPTAVYGVP